MRALFASALVVVSFAFAACGGGQTTPATPAPESSASAAASSAPAPVESAAPAVSAVASASAAPAASSAAPVAVPSAWSKDLSKDEKVAFMKAVIVPKMKQVFQDHDAKEFAEFGCGTCHGKPPKAPHDALPKLSMKGGKITAFADKKLGADAKWMAEKVVPEMAAAMGMKPFDPKTKEGFGCMGCHTVDMAK